MISTPTHYPDNEPTPFWPLLYLGNKTLEVLFPYVVRAIDEDLVGGDVDAELTNLRHAIRAHLQHYGVFVDD